MTSVRILLKFEYTGSTSGDMGMGSKIFITDAAAGCPCSRSVAFRTPRPVWNVNRDGVVAKHNQITQPHRDSTTQSSPNPGVQEWRVSNEHSIYQGVAISTRRGHLASPPAWGLQPRAVMPRYGQQIVVAYPRYPKNAVLGPNFNPNCHSFRPPRR